MTRYSDAALLKGDYAHLAAEMRAGERAAPGEADWEKASCDNQAEETAQEVARHIFAVQQSLDPDKEQLDILTFSAAGQMKVIALHPGEGDLIRIDGMLLSPTGETGAPVSVVVHANMLSLTFLRAPLAKNADEQDDGLKIGFVIFDELKDRKRQKARYEKDGKSAGRKRRKIDLTKPFGLPPARPSQKSAGDKNAGARK